MVLKIYQVAAKFQKSLQKTASFPSIETIKPVIQKVIDNAKSNNRLLKSVQSIDNLSLQNTISEGIKVYFQLVVDPTQYNMMIEEPTKSEVINMLKPMIEETLAMKFAGFVFKVQIGIVT